MRLKETKDGSLTNCTFPQSLIFDRGRCSLPYLCFLSALELRPNSTEHQMALEKQSRQSDADSLDLTLTGRVKRVLISLTGKSFERALCWRLSWYNYLFVFHSFSSPGQ